MTATRFAPSPTGLLHLGHAWAAMVAADHGAMRLRIEDIDRGRSKPEWEAAIHADLDWLGLPPVGEVVRQSDRRAAYDEALDALWVRDLLYPCTCTRRDVAAALSAPQEGDPLMGPDGLVYPGTCRGRGGFPRSLTERPRDAHLRLDMGAAAAALAHRAGVGWGLPFLEIGRVAADGDVWTRREDYLDRIGDVVLYRRDFGTSYHLSVVVDDAGQGIDLVTRGADLFEATPIHVLLQRLLGLPTPRYLHHDLVRDAEGKRLAKRDDARSLAGYRAAGWTAADLKARLRESRVAPAA